MYARRISTTISSLCGTADSVDETIHNGLNGKRARIGFSFQDHMQRPAINRPGLTDRAPEARPVPTIFHEPWWLEIASGGACREASVSSNGMVIGRLPYLLSRKVGGQKVLIMPEMTHVLGPAMAAEIVAGDSTRSLRQFNITSDLIAQLPKASYTWFRLHRGVTNTLAFEAAGFSTGVDFTIEIPPASREQIWRHMRDKTRNVIRRAQERLNVAETADPELFLDFYDRNLRERGLRNHYNRDICRHLITETLSRGVGRLLIATDSAGESKSGIFTVWDHESEYYFMSTRTGDSSNGATSLLIWTAIQHAALQGLTFNTDGVNSKSSLLLLTGFGGVLKPSYFVWKASKKYQAARYVRSLLTSRAA
jgi:hypothetical protein